MSDPHLTQFWPCPGCGHDNDMALDVCAQCRRARRPGEGITTAPAAPPQLHDPGSWIPWQVPWILLGLCLVLVVTGSVPPTLGLILLTVLLPALLQLFVVVSETGRQEAGKPHPVLGWVLAAMVGVAILVPAAVFFLTVCFTSGLVGEFVFGERFETFYPAVGLGLIAASVVAYLMVCILFRRGPWHASNALLTQRLETALREKFGEGGLALMADARGQNADKLRTLLTSVDRAENVDDLRKLL